MKMHGKSNGFTLVELIIVIAVIGILAAILIPTFSNVIEKANAKSALSDARNTIEQYCVDSYEQNRNSPEHIVVIVKKGGNYYLFGYETNKTGEIQISANNPHKNCDTFSELMSTYAFNDKHEGEIPESGKTDYSPIADGTFYLVPYENNVSQAPDIKSFTTRNNSETYLELSSTMSDSLKIDDELFIYHGILLGASWETTEPTPTSTPEPPAQPTEPPVTEESVYYYGNTYISGSTMDLVYSTSKMPSATGNYPVSTINGTPSGNTISMQYPLQNGQTINRTFSFDNSDYTVIGSTTFYKCTETTLWSSAGISNAVFVEKTAGATVSNSIALETLKSTNNDTYIGSGKTIVLLEDISLTQNWLPIAFNGVMSASFDGMGYAVNNMVIDNPAISSVYGVGFVANVGSSGSIVNLALPNASIEHLNTNSVQFYVGIAVGKNAGAITNVHTDGYAKFQNSSKGLGGIVGYTMATSTVSECSSSATLVNTNVGTGGILGRADAGTITINNCWFDGDLFSTNGGVGGILGYKYSSATANISNCWSSGTYFATPTSTEQFGGIAGSATSISHCYSTAAICNALSSNSYSHPISKDASVSTSFFLAGQHYTSATASMNGHNLTITSSVSAMGIVADGNANGTSTNIVGLANVATGTSGVWNTTGSYPVLIGNYGYAAPVSLS